MACCLPEQWYQQWTSVMFPWAPMWLHARVFVCIHVHVQWVVLNWGWVGGLVRVSVTQRCFHSQVVFVSMSLCFLAQRLRLCTCVFVRVGVYACPWVPVGVFLCVSMTVIDCYLHWLLASNDIIHTIFCLYHFVKGHRKCCLCQESVWESALVEV